VRANCPRGWSYGDRLRTDRMQDPDLSKLTNELAAAVVHCAPESVMNKVVAGARYEPATFGS
jgi:hypothetical protein